MARLGADGKGRGLSTEGRQARSRRVERGEWDEIPPGRPTGQQGCDGAGTREGEEEPVLVLFALGRPCAEGAKHGRGWGVGQRGRLPCLGAESLRPHRGGTRQQEPQGMRQEGWRGGAVAVAGPCDRLDSVCTMPTRTRDVLLHTRRCGGRQGGDTTAGGVASGHPCGCAEDTPRLGPRSRRRGTRRRQAAPGWRARVRGRREGDPRRVQPARRLQAGCGVAPPDGRARQAEAASEQRPMRQPRAHLRGSAMAVPAAQERGPWPVATPAGQEPDQAQRVLRAGGPCARAETGGHQRACEPCKEPQRQRTIGLIIMVVKREFLRPVGWIVGVIEAQDNGGRRLRVAREAVGHQRLGQPREVRAVHTVCPPRAGRRAGASLRWSQGGALHAQWKQGGSTEASGILAVRLAGGDVREPLGQEVSQRVRNVGRRACLVSGGCAACGEANLAIDAAA